MAPDDRRARMIGIPAFGIGIPFALDLYGPLGPGDAVAWLGAAMFLALSAAIWHGNRWWLLRRRSARDWLEHPGRRVAVLGAGIVLFTAPLTIAVMLAWERVARIDVDVRAVALLDTIAVMIVAHVYETVLLIKDREADLVRVARLEQARSEAELLALRRQLDPHFIFNSLNTLHQLVEDDPARAPAFIADLAAMMRYLLHTAAQHEVALADELDFARRYAALLARRFGDAFQVAFVDRGADLDARVPPSSLQLLLENAAKHNVFHARAPLVVDVLLEADRVVVANPCVPRADAAPGEGVGLRNLAQRVRLATGRELVIEHDAACFRVAIPLAEAS